MKGTGSGKFAMNIINVRLSNHQMDDLLEAASLMLVFCSQMTTYFNASVLLTNDNLFVIL